MSAPVTSRMGSVWTPCACTPCRFCSDRLQGFRLYAATRETYLERVGVRALILGTPIIAEDGHPVLDEHGEFRFDIDAIELRICALARERDEAAMAQKDKRNLASKLSARRKAARR